MIEELINIDNEKEELKKRRIKVPVEQTSLDTRVKKEDPRRDRKWKQKDFARKEDWEIFAENRDRNHVSFSQTIMTSFVFV